MIESMGSRKKGLHVLHGVLGVNPPSIKHSSLVGHTNFFSEIDQEATIHKLPFIIIIMERNKLIKELNLTFKTHLMKWEKVIQQLLF